MNRIPVALGSVLIFIRLALPGSVALAAPHAPAASASLAPSFPPLYTMALPARVAFVAWLPVTGAADEVDLDLRVEVVLPLSCGDKVAGLMRRGGPTIAGPDAWDVVVERRPVGACKKEPTRISARSSIRMRLAAGDERELVVGAQRLQVKRKREDQREDKRAVTVDGQEPEGDAPGAPPTARPVTLVLGEVVSAKLGATKRVAGDPGVATAEVRVGARWPACAGAPLGFLARGDAKTHYALTLLEPLARAPLDGACKGAELRQASIATVVHVPTQASTVEISVGALLLSLHLGAPDQAPPTKRETLTR